MSSSNTTITRLKTGVPGLDEVLGGGLPEYSFNILAGTPGCGKTTLAHQIMFALATKQRPALCGDRPWCLQPSSLRSRPCPDTNSDRDFAGP